MKIHFCCFVMCLLVAISVHTGVGIAGDDNRDPQRTAVKQIKGARPISDEPAQRVFYISYDKNEEDLQTVHARLVKAGARTISVIVPDAIVCELPLRVDPGEVLDGMNMISRVQPLGGIALAPALPGDLDWLRRAYDTIDTRELEKWPGGQPQQAGPTDPMGLAEVSRASIKRSAFLAQQRLDSPDAATTQDDPLPDQNTEFLAGNIHMQIVFVEVKDSHSWTTTEKNQVKAEIEIVKMFYERHFRTVGANFTSRTFDAVVGWEPLDHGLNEVTDIPPLMDDAMARMGYLGEQSEYLERVNRFNNDARLDYRNTDWVFTAFVVDSSHDPDHAFAAKKQIYAALGGPFMVLAYPSVASFDAMFKFAMTVIFWGMPEDLNASPGECDDRTGYLNIRHGNEILITDPVYGSLDCDNDFVEPCTAWLGMMMMGYTGMPCEFTMGHLGNVDMDNDNVTDVFDAPPRVVYRGSDVDTLISLEQPVKLIVRSQAVPNKNSQQEHERMDYATEIERVYYHLNGIGPILVQPVDGIADELYEEYEIQIQFLLPGYSLIEVTAWNNFGARSEPKGKQLYYLGLNYFSFRFEHRDDGIGLAWYLRGETFDADLELHRIDYGADFTDTIIAYPDDLQPVGLPHNGLTPYYYLDKTAAASGRYGYYVEGTFEIYYRGEMAEFTSNSQQYETVAPLPRPGGILSAPAPNPFQPAKGAEKVLMSITIPGAEGIPMYNRSGGVSTVSAQQQTPEPITLKVAVYDVAGREVRILFDEAVFERVVNVEWNGNDKTGNSVPTGIYFVKAKASEITDTQKVLLIR